MLSHDQIKSNDTLQLTKTEKTVRDIWSEVLQQDKINPEDNFFELGGDSLMTMMVIFRINDVLNIDLPPGTIMEAPTLREFCIKIDEGIAASESEILPEGEFFDTQELESGVI